MTTPESSDPFPGGRVLGDTSVSYGGMVSYEAKAEYQDSGPILVLLRSLMNHIEADNLPGEIERITIDRFEFARMNNGKSSIYRYDVEVVWSIEAGKMDDETRRRLLSY